MYFVQSLGQDFLNASVEILLVKVSLKEIPHYHFTAFFRATHTNWCLVFCTVCQSGYVISQVSPLGHVQI